MPKNGYWIECIPVYGEVNQSDGDSVYDASISSFPEIRVTAHSPEQAIAELRSKLDALRQHYCKTGKVLPERDNPVRPPSRLRSVRGWISIYVQVTE